jgi:triosephosphate isomerase
MRDKLVIGNWKMHGELVQNQLLIKKLIDGLVPFSQVKVAVCVPFPYLAQAQSLLQQTPIAWGGQNMNQHANGAFTGEVSAAMLIDFGCRFVIVGHSERRVLYLEDNRVVANKFKAAHDAGLVPVLCVGETLQEREQGMTEKVIAAQLNAVIEAAGIKMFGSAVIAYEPVWAIGTGKTATPQQAQAVHQFIREQIAVVDEQLAERLPILYGGSVKPGNAAELFAMPDIDGGLIGGASLVAEEFIAICQAGKSVN